MNILTFKISLKGLEPYLEREIEFSENSLLSTFSYAILSSFNAKANHLFNVNYKGNRFEFIFDNMDLPPYVSYYNPSLYKLSELNLNIGDKFTLEYDYGASWIFNIEYIDKKPMKNHTHMHYPYLISGKGYGIIEDMPPYDLLDIINKNDGIFDGTDYKEFPMELINTLLKGEIEFYKEAYEHHIINKEKLVLNFNDTNIDNSNIIDFQANKMWLSIPEEIRNFYIHSAYCHNCFSKYGDSSFMDGYKIKFDKGMLIIDGKCSRCKEHMVRTCD